MIDPQLDGITHVNIYSQGKTELGRMLSNFYHFKFNTTEGTFNSVEGYWHWLGIQDCEEKEILKTLHGYKAKEIGTKLKKRLKSKFDNNFERKILLAIFGKSKYYKNLFLSDIGKLPFEHYYNFGGKIVDAKEKYKWMIDGINKIRNYIY